jgi:hypothetical protein
MPVIELTLAVAAGVGGGAFAAAIGYRTVDRWLADRRRANQDARSRAEIGIMTPEGPYPE